VFDQRGELPLLPFGNPIGFVPASRGGVYIESKADSRHPRLQYSRAKIPVDKREATEAYKGGKAALWSRPLPARASLAAPYEPLHRGGLS